MKDAIQEGYTPAVVDSVGDNNGDRELVVLNAGEAT